MPSPFMKKMVTKTSLNENKEKLIMKYFPKDYNEIRTIWHNKYIPTMNYN
jgi:hypothetical protein